MGHEFDVVAANQEEFRIRLVIDEEELSDNKAVFTITNEMLMPSNVVQVEFINDSSHSFHVNYIDTETLEEEMVIANLRPSATSSETVGSFPGHEFAVYDEDHTFRVRVVVGEGHASGVQVIFRITDEMIHPQKPVDVEFINDASSKQIHINCIDPDNYGGEELIIWNLSPKKHSDGNSSFHFETIHSFTSHNFIACDEDHSFRLGLQVSEDHNAGDKATFAITDEIIIIKSQ